MSFYVFDLDGTLADCSHRLHFIDRDRDGGPDWRAFFAACVNDVPIHHMIGLCDRLAHSPGAAVEIWSGRSDEVRDETMHWLARNRIHPRLLTNMRRAGDHRPDFLVKQEFFDKSPMRPTLIFDDRKQVVDMWRANGIPCAQVADGDF